VEQEIERRSHELAAGNFRPAAPAPSRKKPADSAIDIPTYLFTPIPREPDRPSMFENNEIAGVIVESLRVRLLPPSGAVENFELANLVFQTVGRELVGKGEIRDGKIPLVSAVQACDGSAWKAPIPVSFTVSADSFEFRTLGNPASPWTGRLFWDGGIRFRSTARELEGTVTNPVCRR
jgi:hypothetical protein